MVIHGVNTFANASFIVTDISNVIVVSFTPRVHHLISQVLTESALLPVGTRPEVEIIFTRLSEERRAKQPLEYPSAGSTFKRPEGYFAGKLIMDAGLRGYQVGGAQVSEKHCGFVINKGDATAEDVRTLMTDVQDKVKAEFGVMLEPEVICLGEF